MPKIPTDYTKTIIYKLVHKEDFDNANIYIGSTTNFRQRKGAHKNCCNNENDKKYNQKNYQSIRNNGGWNEWNMIEIEKYPCNDKREAETKEEYWRTHFNAVLNSKACCSLTNNKTEYNKMYRETNKEKIAEKDKKYRDKNKEKTAEYDKIYNEVNKDKISERRKIYYETNKIEINQKSKMLRNVNIDEVNRNRREHYELTKNEINRKRREYQAKKREQNNQTV